MTPNRLIAVLYRVGLGCLTPMLLAGPVWSAPLYPDEVVRRSVAGHPAVKRARSLTEAALAYGQGAGALPNPILQLSTVAGDPDADSNSLVQTLEIAGQPGLRQKAADNTTAAKAAQEKALRNSVGLAAALAYYDYWEALQNAEQADRQIAITNQLREVAQQRFQLGEISANERLRLQLLSGQSQTILSLAQGDLDLAQQKLEILLQEPGPFELPTVLDPLPIAPMLGSLSEADLLAGVESGPLGRPELEAAEREAAAAAWVAKLTGRAGAPNLQLSAYSARLGQGSEQGVQLSVVMPLFDWGRLGAAHARDKKLVEAQGFQLELVRRQVTSDLGTAATRYRVAKGRRIALGDQAQQADQLSRTATQGYEIGLLSLVELLEIHTTFRESLRQYIGAEADSQRARVQLYWAFGWPMTDVGGSAENNGE